MQFETALFYRVLPNRTLKFKKKKCSSRKNSKERPNAYPFSGKEVKREDHL